jgi:outer membrane protein assembly factor BamA
MPVRLPATLVLLLFTTSVFAEPSWDVPQRRKEQFPTEFAYLLAPLPYSMPGIGEGYFLMGYMSNIFDTTADAAIVSVQGDATGLVSQFDEIPLIKDRLFLQLMDMDINKATVSDYESRGMDSSSDYNLVEVSGVRQQSAELTLSLWERRIAFLARYKSSANDVEALRNSGGDLLAEYNPPVRSEGISRSIGAMLDLTDDYQDPRDGLRLRLDITDHPAIKSSDPDFFVMDYSLLYYLPFNHTDTMVFNFFRSDAHLRSQGETNPAAIIAEWGGSSCAPSDTACISAETQRLNNTISANRYGTATSLGGTDRLRSYADGRFSGAHMEFVGIELRSNFVQDAEPFDYLIWKDVRTSVQLAVFAELGTVAETRDDLWKETHSSVGIGARLVTASGSVYRADWATGDEGSEFSVFFFYPWK